MFNPEAYPDAKDYPQKRYLKFCSDDELKQRYDDILGNSFRFDPTGKTVLHKSATVLLAHIILEFCLRGQRNLAFPSLKNFHLDDAKHPKARVGVALWKKKEFPLPFFLKFGKREHLEPMLTKGTLRIGSASSYRAKNLPAAIRDNELDFSQAVANLDVGIQDDEGCWRSVRLVGPVHFQKTAESDYYLSCYSLLFENRLFDDFDADACLVIRDVNRFDFLIQQAFSASLPGWAMRFGGVDYLDPVCVPLAGDIHFAKHFRYGYQREARYVWIPAEPADDLGYLHLDLGDLSAFSELILL